MVRSSSSPARNSVGGDDHDSLRTTESEGNHQVAESGAGVISILSDAEVREKSALSTLDFASVPLQVTGSSSIIPDWRG